MFEVASYRGLTDSYVYARPGSWLLKQFDLVLRARWNEAMGMVSAVEVGLSRVLRVALGKKTDKKLPPLPSYDEAMGHKAPSRHPSPPAGWVDNFERVNEVGPFARGPASDLKDEEG